MRPICVKCQRFYLPERNGAPLLEQMPDNDKPGPLAGTIEAHRWHPYKLWMGDLWICEGCGSEIVVGVGTKPLAEHYQEHFASELKREGGDAVLRVNDC